MSVQSVSVIPEPIKRDTYLHDCATRLGVNEQTLINTMNRYIRAKREEKNKERERESNSSQHENGEDAPTAGTNVQSTVAPLYQGRRTPAT